MYRDCWSRTLSPVSSPSKRYIISPTRRVHWALPLLLSLLIGLSLNLIPVIASAQHTTKPSDSTSPLSAEEQHVRSLIERAKTLTSRFAIQTEEERWNALQDQAPSGSLLPTSAREAFDKQFQPLKPTLQQYRADLLTQLKTVQELDLEHRPDSPHSQLDLDHPRLRLAVWRSGNGHVWLQPHERPILTAGDQGSTVSNVTSLGNGQHQVIFSNGDRMTATATSGMTRIETMSQDIGDGATATIETWNTNNDQIASDHSAMEIHVRQSASESRYGAKNLARVARCPTADGVVPGSSELNVALSGSAAGQSGSVRLQGATQSEGHVGDDAVLTEVVMHIEGSWEQRQTQAEPDGRIQSTVTGLQMAGTTSFNPHGATAPAIQVTRCTVSLNDESATIPSSTCQSLLQSGGFIEELRKKYSEAEDKWNNPDDQQNGSECVKLHFTPPTRTKEVAPGQSTDVKTEIRTVKSAQPTWGRLSELEDYRGGHASPASVGTAPQTPAVFRFVAPSDLGDPNDPPGFYVNKGTSRAGRIKSKNLWQIAAPSLVLEFDSMIVGAVQYGKSHARAVVPLRYTRERGYVGQGPLHYETVPSRMAPCIVIVEGKGTTTFDVTAGSAQRQNNVITDYWLVIRPGDTDEIGRLTPCKGPPPPPVQTSFWSGLFNITRFMHFNWQLAGFPMTGWTIVNQGDVLATKIMKTNCNRLCDETTTMTLKRKSNPAAASTGGGQ